MSAGYLGGYLAGYTEFDPLAVAPAGIASPGLAGSPTVSFSVVAAPAGVASPLLVGSPVVVASGVTVATPLGVVSLGAVGTPSATEVPLVTSGRLIFMPPVEYANTTTVAEPHPGNTLFRHFGPRQTGVLNVYIMADGTVTTADPVYGAKPAVTFHSGHICDVTAAQATLLRAAGYTVMEV